MKQKINDPFALVAITFAMLFTSAPARAAQSNKLDELSFENSYAYETYLKDNAIKTAAKDGVLTLTGTVVDELHKDLALALAVSLPGVTSVDNQLKTTAEVASEDADTRMGRKVKFALLLHRNVRISKINVVVKDGIVTLTGEAPSAAQKELSTEYASDIEGVKSVINEMTVAETPEPVEQTESEQMDDASVTAQVKTALYYHHSTSSIATKVVTRNGEVTLTGIALNDAEKSRISKLVADIMGVTCVKNQMTIDETKTL